MGGGIRGVVLHDYFAIRGGGERLVETLARGLGWPVVTGFVSDPLRRTDWPAVEVHSLGVRASHPLHRTLALVHAFRRWRPPPDARIAVFSGTYAPLAAPALEGVRKVYYCHSPPRFLYDQREFFLRRLPPWQRPGFLALGAWLRRRYREAVRAMDLVVCNSGAVRRRLRRYLGVEAEVVYPPVDTERFHWREPEGYYLSLARLDPLKRVDRIVEAFLGLPDRRLVVASGGPEAERLRRLAGDAPNIRFTGWLDDAALADLIGGAVAVLYLPRHEDFGISPVEAMAAGKPVIGVAEGGLVETVVDGETGILLPPDPPVRAVREAVASLDPARAAAMRPACEARARAFDRRVFLERMQRLIVNLMNG